VNGQCAGRSRRGSFELDFEGMLQMGRIPRGILVRFTALMPATLAVLHAAGAPRPATRRSPEDASGSSVFSASDHGAEKTPKRKNLLIIGASVPAPETPGKPPPGPFLKQFLTDPFGGKRWWPIVARFIGDGRTPMGDSRRTVPPRCAQWKIDSLLC
jgi:hypothetical protein